VPLEVGRILLALPATTSPLSCHFRSAFFLLLPFHCHATHTFLYCPCTCPACPFCARSYTQLPPPPLTLTHYHTICYLPYLFLFLLGLILPVASCNSLPHTFCPTCHTRLLAPLILPAHSCLGQDRCHGQHTYMPHSCYCLWLGLAHTALHHTPLGLQLGSSPPRTFSPSSSTVAMPLCLPSHLCLTSCLPSPASHYLPLPCPLTGCLLSLMGCSPPHSLLPRICAYSPSTLPHVATPMPGALPCRVHTLPSSPSHAASIYSLHSPSRSG